MGSWIACQSLVMLATLQAGAIKRPLGAGPGADGSDHGALFCASKNMHRVPSQYQFATKLASLLFLALVPQMLPPHLHGAMTSRLLELVMVLHAAQVQQQGIVTQVWTARGPQPQQRAESSTAASSGGQEHANNDGSPPKKLRSTQLLEARRDEGAACPWSCLHQGWTLLVSKRVGPRNSSRIGGAHHGVREQLTDMLHAGGYTADGGGRLVSAKGCDVQCLCTRRPLRQSERQAIMKRAHQLQFWEAAALAGMSTHPPLTW